MSAYLIVALVPVVLFLFWHGFLGPLFEAISDYHYRTPRLPQSREDAPPNGERGA